MKTNVLEYMLTAVIDMVCHCWTLEQAAFFVHNDFTFPNRRLATWKFFSSLG